MPTYRFKVVDISCAYSCGTTQDVSSLSTESATIHAMSQISDNLVTDTGYISPLSRTLKVGESQVFKDGNGNEYNITLRGLGGLPKS